MARSGTGSKLHELHIATCLADLNNIIDPDSKITNSKLNFGSGMLQKIYNEGEGAERKKDEESAYIFYMRFMAMTMMSSKEIQKEFHVRLATAISKSEQLSESLGKRYETAKLYKEVEERAKKLELEDATENAHGKGGGMANGVVPVPTWVNDPHGVTPDELKTLIDKRATRFLLIDTRSPSDFKSSHPKHPESISISHIILTSGVSAHMLGGKIKISNPDSYDMWNRRASFDLIILYDWNSSFEKREPGSPIFVLYDAMTQWDPHTKYRGGIKILQGGIRNFYHKYPSYFTNPCPSNGPSHEEGKTPAPISLAAISYPSLDDPNPTGEENNNPNKKPRTITTNPTVNRTTKPNHLLSHTTNGQLPTTNGIPQLEKSLEDHGKEVAAVLDDIISVSKRTQAAEADWNKFQESHGDASPEELKEKLKEKEKIIDEMSTQLLAKNLHFDELKAHYEESLEKERGKRSLPAVRLTPIESEIATKEKLKEDLAKHVTKIREERKRKEADGHFNGPPQVLLNGHHSETGVSQPRPGSVRPSLPPTRPSSQDVTPRTYTEKLRPEGEQQRNNTPIKRSHSNPNLAQMVFDEVPTYNRNQKPQLRARRDLPTVSSTMRTHRTGIKNLGNTCYMSSIVQCLSHTSDLADILTSAEVRQLAIGGGKTRGDVTKEVGWTIQQLHFGHRSIAPEELKRVIGKYHAPFSGYTQHDSHELLTFLLDWMHEELNKSTGKKLKEQNNDNVPDEQASATFWKDFLSSSDSPISRLFAGEQRSCLKCLSCHKESVTFGAFYFLSIPMPSTGNKSTLASCLDLYMSPEVLPDLKCVHCKANGKTEKKFDLWRLPKYLIIHLQRFHHNGDGNCRKRINEVECPLDNLEMSPWVKGSTTTPTNYNLYAISNHYGSMEGGHYTAFCRNSEFWTKFDDSDVSIISSREVCTTAAYILFYQLQEN